MYRLRFDPAAEAVYEALPPRKSEPLILALAAACEDPLAATSGYGEVEDDVMRIIDTPHTRAVLLLGHTLKTITVLQISHLG